MRSIWVWVGMVACGSPPELGTSCFDESECGDVLTCYCPIEQEVPGVCSVTCQTDEDCADWDPDATCRPDFCTGVSLCLVGG